MAVELRKRDRNALAVAAASLVLFAVAQFLVFPMFDKRDALKRRVETAEKKLEEMPLLRAEYLAKTASAEESSEKSVHGKDFSLFSLMEKYAGASGIKDSIAYIKPSTVERKDATYKVAMVEMKLEEDRLGSAGLVSLPGGNVRQRGDHLPTVCFQDFQARRVSRRGHTG